MDKPSSLAAARERLVVLLAEAVERAQLDEARESFRRVNEWVAENHQADVDKLRAGYNHHDPEVQQVWRDHVGDRTPADTWGLIRQMKNPPGKRGRPKGRGGYAAVDQEVLPELERRVRNGEGKAKVAMELAAHLPRGGTPESVVRRLSRRLQKKSP